MIYVCPICNCVMDYKVDIFPKGGVKIYKYCECGFYTLVDVSFEKIKRKRRRHVTIKKVSTMWFPEFFGGRVLRKMPGKVYFCLS